MGIPSGEGANTCLRVLEVFSSPPSRWIKARQEGEGEGGMNILSLDHCGNFVLAVGFSCGAGAETLTLVTGTSGNSGVTKETNQKQRRIPSKLM